VQGTTEIQIGSYNMLACHFPYVGDSQHEDRHAEHRPKDQGRWLLHGHTHSKEKINGRMIHVGVDAWNFMPVSETELAVLVSRAQGGKAEPQLASTTLLERMSGS